MHETTFEHKYQIGDMFASLRGRRYTVIGVGARCDIDGDLEAMYVCRELFEGEMFEDEPAEWVDVWLEEDLDCLKQVTSDE